MEHIETLRAKDVMRVLTVSRSTAYNIIKKIKQHYKIGQRRQYITADELKAYYRFEQYQSIEQPEPTKQLSSF